jgi:hypothetical protein
MTSKLGDFIGKALVKIIKKQGGKKAVEEIRAYFKKNPWPNSASKETTLKFIHPLTYRTKASACTSHRIGYKSSYIRITPVNIMQRWQYPPCYIGFSGLYNILSFPCYYISKFFN